MGQIVVASNRGPVSFTAGGVARRGGGGLASALAPVLAGSRNAWVAAAMTEADREVAAAEPGGVRLVPTPLGDFRLRLVSMPEPEYRGYYDAFSNRVLWYTLHGMYSPPTAPALYRADHDAWDAYVRANERFARACGELLGPGDRLLVQDYHLALVPALVRDRAPGVRIAHFTHTAWPSLSDLRVLPDAWVERIVRGLLGADVVGFHSSRWAARFLEAAEYLGAVVGEASVDVDRRRVHVGVFPLGPDVDALDEAANSPAAAAAGRDLDERIAGRRVVLRVERLEPAKNTVRGLAAFEQMLEDRPDLRDDVVHLAFVYPSRQNLPEYARYRDRILERAAAIEGRFPGSLVLETDDRYERAMAALQRYDVLVVNSLADGLNLVAKEGAILNRRHGGIVLSREAGAADDLGAGAQVINPTDTAATAAAIATILDEPAEVRARRAAVLRAAAARTSPRTWLEAQLSLLGQLP